MARLKHVVKLAETLLSIGAHLVVLEGFCCSRQGDVRPIGGEVRAGVHHRRGFWSRRQDARSTANTAVILVLKTGRRQRYVWGVLSSWLRLCLIAVLVWWCFEDFIVLSGGMFELQEWTLHVT
jgi:hypothetical protein